MTKLFVLDNNGQEGNSLQSLLVENGYDVTLAADESELEKARGILPGVIFTDFTHQKHTDQNLLASEVRYRRLFESAKDGILILDASLGEIMDVNPFLVQLLGYEHEYFMGKNLWEIGLFKDIAASKEAFIELLKNGYVRYEDLPLETKDGRQIEVEFVSNVYLVNSTKVVQCNIRDITDRKRSEHDLLASEVRYRRLFESAKDGILILDASTGEIMDVNPFLVQLLGFEHAYFFGRNLWELGLFKDIAASKESFSELLEKGYVRYEDLPLETKDGRRVEVEFVSNVYQVSSTKVVQCNIRDITERKRSEEALILHTKRVQALLDLQQLSYASEEHVLDFILEACLTMTQSDYSFVGTLNETESEMTIHRCSEENMAKCMLPAQPGESRNCAAKLWKDCVRKHESVICNDYQTRHSNKQNFCDGHVLIHRFAAVPVLDGNLLVAVAVVANKKHDYVEADVNALSNLLQKMWEILSRQQRECERETLEEQYRQAQKMEAIGQLAGGVAHDFNNILQAIVGYSSILLDSLPEHDERHEFVEAISQGADRATTLTRQLLAFSRRQILDMEDLDLNEVVQSMMKMICRLIGENIEVKTVVAPHVGIVHADRGQMEQVLLNLCVNARDAMPLGGLLTIETTYVMMDKEYCAVHDWATTGQYVLLSVMDTGSGMDEQTQARIFEPFFTTKEFSKGTGLGLSTVYGIVRQHQGMIQVASELGNGATFKVYLPCFDGKATTVGRRGVARAHGGTETILVVEDDETIRKLAIRILESAGYTVLLAVNGKEAIDVFEKHSADIDLCLLDVMMPKMGGKAVYDVLYPQYPRLRFLFASGYSKNTIHTGFVRQAGIELIQKPYAPDALLRQIRQVLDETNKNLSR